MYVYMYNIVSWSVGIYKEPVFIHMYIYFKYLNILCLIRFYDIFWLHSNNIMYSTKPYPRTDFT